MHHYLNHLGKIGRSYKTRTNNLPSIIPNDWHIETETILSQLTKIKFENSKKRTHSTKHVCIHIKTYSICVQPIDIYVYLWFILTCQYIGSGAILNKDRIDGVDDVK